MSTLDELKSAIYDDVVAVVGNHTASPDAHVIRADDDEPDSPPMVSLSASVTDDDSRRGIHDVRVVEVEENPLDVLYGRDKSLSVDVTIADVDGTRADTIHDQLSNAFTYDSRIRDPQSLIGANGPPIHDVNATDASPINRDQRVGHALDVSVDYTRTFYHSDIEDPPTAVTEVRQQFEDSEDDRVFVTDENSTSIETT
jgi:hypothetical protein